MKNENLVVVVAVKASY